MAAEAIAAGLTAAAGIGTSIGQSIANANLNKKNRAWQEKMTEQQYQRNVELWNMQNAYNTPAEQVKRLREAGLNPNLLYGNGSAATGNAGDVTPGDVPSTPTSVPYDFSQANNGLASALAMYQNWQLNNYNMRKIQEETTNTSANTAYINSMRAGQDLKNSLLGVDLSWADKNYAIDYLGKEYGLSKTASETFLNNARKREVELGIFQNSAAFETKLELLKAQVLQSKAAALNAYGNFQESMDRIRVGLYGSQAGLNRSSASLNNQQYDFLNPFYSNGINPNWTVMNGPGIAAGFGNFVNKSLKKQSDAIANGLKSAYNWTKSKFK